LKIIQNKIDCTGSNSHLRLIESACSSVLAVKKTVEDTAHQAYFDKICTNTCYTALTQFKQSIESDHNQIRCLELMAYSNLISRLSQTPCDFGMYNLNSVNFFLFCGLNLKMNKINKKKFKYKFRKTWIN